MKKKELKEAFNADCTELDKNGNSIVKGTPNDIINLPFWRRLILLHSLYKVASGEFSPRFGLRTIYQITCIQPARQAGSQAARYFFLNFLTLNTCQQMLKIIPEALVAN